MNLNNYKLEPLTKYDMKEVDEMEVWLCFKL